MACAALSAAPFVSASQARAPRARGQALIVCAQRTEAAPLQLLGVGLAAAAAALTVQAVPAQAGVVLVQPEVKNFVTGNEPAKAAPGASKVAAKKAAPRASEMSGAPDLRFLALPASVVGIAAAGVALSKADDGFLEVLDKGSLRDSNVMGVGYEANSGLKDSYFFVDGGAKEVKGVPGAGRAAAKPATKAGTKAGTGKTSGTGTIKKLFGQ